jgi:predicted nucleic acid-binding protein
MILVDTPVWIDHLRAGDEELARLLDDTRVVMHAFVIGELACGNLNNRTEVLTLLGGLPQATMATDSEVLYFIEQHRLMGQGIGYIDVHLLASVSLANPSRLWTRDKRLAAVAADLGMSYKVKARHE